MRILIVMDPLDRVDVYKDTTFGFMLSAQALQHQVYFCEQAQLFVRNGYGFAHAALIEVDLNPKAPFQLGVFEETALSDFHTVWMRKDPPVDRAYLHATHILDLAASDTFVVNSPRGIRYANEKLYAQMFPQFCPETLVSRDCKQLKMLIRNAPEPIVVKPVDGHGGAGVFVVHPDDRNAGSIIETLTEDGQRWVVAQTYIPKARIGDKRIILIDGEIQGAILRVPQSDDNRGNIHVGGRVEHTELTQRESEICRALGPRLREDGLWFVGLDIIGDYLTEINVTSPTGIREIQEFTGRDVGHAYVQWVAEQTQAR
jgi:glutathione synthase